MDFHQLVAKMQQLDQPVGEAQVTECPPDMPGAMNTPMSAPTPPTTPPSMSINMNAQGMDNIADILKLIAKVNPDAAPQEPGLPSMSAPPSIMSITPSQPPLKMLPDLSDEPGDDMEGPEDDDGKVVKLDLDDKKEEEFANEPDDCVWDVDAVTHDGNDLNKSKATFPKVAGGDNPMQRMESTDLRSQIRAELQRRLNEAKGVK